MSDLAVTGTQVVKASNASVTNGTAAQTITAGQTVYQNASGFFALAQGNASATATVTGIALNPAAANQPIQVLTAGGFSSMNSISGFSGFSGMVYVLSAANPGGIAPNADLVTGNQVSVLGVASSPTLIQVQLQNSGATKQ